MSNCSWNSLLFPSPQILMPSLLFCLTQMVCWPQKKTTPSLVSATLPGHETCRVSPLFIKCCPHSASRRDAMEMACCLRYLFSPAKTCSSNGLTPSNAEQAVQQPLGRALSGKKCQLEM